MLFSKIKQLYIALNGYKKLTVNFFLCSVPFMQIPVPEDMSLHNAEVIIVWIKLFSGIGGLFLLVYGFVKGWYQIRIYHEELKVKRVERRKAEADWNDYSKKNPDHGVK